MASQNLTNFLNGLQPVFGKRVHQLSKEKSKYFNLVTEEARDFDGKHLIEAVTSGYPGAYTDLGPSASSLPTAGNISISQSTIGHTYSYDRIAVDWDLMDQSQGPHSFARALTLLLDRALKGQYRENERKCIGNGSGVLNPLTQGGSTGIRNVTGVSAAAWTFTINVYDAPKFYTGKRLEFWSGTYDQANWRNATKLDTPNQGYYTVTSCVPSFSAGTATVTITEASPNTNPPVNGAYAASDGAIVENVTGSTTNATNEFLGFLAIVSDDDLFLQPNSKVGFTSDDTFQNLATATNSFWASQRIDVNSTQYLDEDQFETAATQMSTSESTADAEDISFILAHRFQIQKFRQKKIAMERYTVMEGTPSLPTGAKSSLSDDRQYITFADKPLMPSRFMPVDKALGMNLSQIRRFVLKPWHFRPAHPDFQNAPADVMDGRVIWQQGCYDRSQCFLIDELKIT